VSLPFPAPLPSDADDLLAAKESVHAAEFAKTNVRWRSAVRIIATLAGWSYLMLCTYKGVTPNALGIGFFALLGVSLDRIVATVRAKNPFALGGTAAMFLIAAAGSMLHNDTLAYLASSLGVSVAAVHALVERTRG
jgi:hypothetical protein